MFCQPDTVDASSDSTMMTPDGLTALLKTCFRLAMAHYTDERLSQDQPNNCPLIQRTIDACTASCFFSKESLSAGFVCRWLEQNVPRLVPPVHRFCLHTLTTAYRGLDATGSRGGCGISGDSPGVGGGGLGLELATPVLDNANPFDALHPPLMPVSQAWLLAGALPSLYARPQQQTATSSVVGQSQIPIVAGGVGGSLASHAFMSKLLSVVPSHWTLLYDSRQHGVGANRFLHHVLGYKGPTLVLLRADSGQVYCVASPTEWRETHLYTGDKGCCIIQLLPK